MAITKLDLTKAVSGTMPVANGGTGVTSAGEIGNLVLISTATASADTSIEFDLDSTYDHFLFRLSKIHVSADTDNLHVDFSLTSDTDYGSATITYMATRYYQSEVSGQGTAGNVNNYSTGTLGVARIANSVSADNDHALDGTFEIYNPSNTTFTKGFRGEIVYMASNDNIIRTVTHGDIRNSAAVDKIKFLMESGNFASGTITQYGIKL